MSKILDQHFIDAVQQETYSTQLKVKEVTSRFSSYVERFHLYKLHIILVGCIGLLAIQVFTPSVFGWQTFYGRYESSTKELNATTITMEEQITRLETLQVAIEKLQHYTFPTSIQELKVNNVLTGSSFSKITSALYRLLSDMISGNVLSKQIMLTRFFWDTTSQTIVIEGYIKKENIMLADIKTPHSGYEALSYFVEHINRSSYFKQAVIESVEEKGKDASSLSFRLLVPLQKMEELDVDDNQQSFIEYLQSTWEQSAPVRRK